MSRRKNHNGETPLDRQRKALEAHEHSLRTELAKNQQIQQKLPDLRQQALEREQREIISRFSRPVSIEGPADYRYDLCPDQKVKKVRKLRAERSVAPLLTIVLVVTLVCVAYYAVRTMWNG